MVLEAVAVSMLVLLAVTTLVGLVLGFFGEFNGAVVFGIAVAAAAFVGASWPRLRPTAYSRSGGIGLTTIFVFASAMTLYNLLRSAQHLLVDRDGGVYSTHAIWLAKTGGHGLQLSAEEEAFGEITGGGEFLILEGLTPRTQGFGLDVEEPFLLETQFPHGLSSVLATGYDLGGTWLELKVPALITFVSLIALGALAMRIAGPWVGSLATAFLAVSPIGSYFGRDTYSETLAQPLIVGGAWLIVLAFERSRWDLAALAGVVFGTALTTRIDIPLALLAMYLAIAVVLALARSRDRVIATGRTALVVSLGIAVGATIYWIDLRHFTGDFYYEAQRSNIFTMWGAAILAAAAGVLIFAARLLPALSSTWTLARTRLAAFAGGTWVPIVGGSVAFLALAYGSFVRPHVETYRVTEDPLPGHAIPGGFIESVQGFSGVAIDGTRSYQEEVLAWPGWYSGPAYLALAAVGLGVAVALTLRTPKFGRLFGLALFIVPAIVFSWRVSIVPDQIWATRRLYPLLIPSLSALAALAAAVPILLLAHPRSGEVVRGWLGSFLAWWRERPAVAYILTAAAALAVVVPSAIGLDRTSDREQLPSRVALNTICSELGPDDVVVITRAPAQVIAAEVVLAPAVRAQCGVPVAIVNDQVTEAALEPLVAQLAEQGQSLVLVTAGDTAFKDAPPSERTELVFEATATGLQKRVEGPALNGSGPYRIYFTRFDEMR